MPVATQLFAKNQIKQRMRPGLQPNDAKPDTANTKFYAPPLLSQRLALLNNMVGRHSQIIIVTGELGSGKTTLMTQYMAGSDLPWRLSHIRIKPCRRFSARVLGRLNNRKIFVAHMNDLPSIIIDDAHQLNPRALNVLLQWAFTQETGPKLKSLLLLADTRMRKRYNEIATCMPENAVIEKINMAPFTEEQTAAYLRHCMPCRGHAAASLFSAKQIHRIHHNTLGWPGSINHEAKRLLGNMKGSSPKGAILNTCTQAFFGVKNFCTKRLALNT